MMSGTGAVPGGPAGPSREEQGSRWGRRLLLILLGMLLMAGMFQTSFRPPSAVRRRTPARLIVPLPDPAPGVPSRAAAGGKPGGGGPAASLPLSRAVLQVYAEALPRETVAEALRSLPVPAEIVPGSRGADLVLRAGAPRTPSPGARPETLLQFEQQAEIPTVAVPVGLAPAQIAGGLLPFLSAGTTGLGAAAVPVRSPSSRTPAVLPGYTETVETPGAPAVRRRRGKEEREPGLFLPQVLPDTRKSRTVLLRANGLWEIRLLPGIAMVEAGTCVTFDLQGLLSHNQWVSLSERPEAEFHLVGPQSPLVPHRTAANRFCLPITAPRDADGRRVYVEARFTPPGRPAVTARSVVILRVPE